MPTATEEITAKIHALPDIEKLKVLDSITAELDQPDPNLDRIWAEEARKRWAAYRERRIPAVPYEEVMAKYRRQ